LFGFLQNYVTELQEKLERRNALLEDAQAQLSAVTEEHETGARNAEQLRAVHIEVEQQLDELTEELQHERAQKDALKVAKQQLQTQLKHMVKAEKDLTKGLRDAHEQIENQLQQLRNDVERERAAKENIKVKKVSSVTPRHTYNPVPT
jgi:chromosome segregation ATPase